MLSTSTPSPLSTASDPSQAALAYAFSQASGHVDVTVGVAGTVGVGVGQEGGVGGRAEEYFTDCYVRYGGRVAPRFSILSGGQPKDITVTIKDTTLEVHIAGEIAPRVRGTLYGKVDSFESLWQVEKVPASARKLVTIHLEKHPGNQIPWPVVIRSGLGSDTATSTSPPPNARPFVPPDDLIADPTIDPHSLFLLASFYEEDRLFPLPDTLRILAAAASRGSTYSKLRLAAVYHLGAGDAVPPDPRRSHEYYLDAARDGSGVACYAVAGAYQNPAADGAVVTEDGQPDFKEAVRWLDRAIFGVEDLKATRPDMYKDACFSAGIMWLQGGYGLGEGNAKMAIEYFKHSVAMGHPPSCYNTAVILLNGPGLLANGSGVSRNIHQAVRLFKAARSLDPTYTMPDELEQLGEKGLMRLEDLDKEYPDVPVAELVARVKDEVDRGVVAGAAGVLANNGYANGRHSVESGRGVSVSSPEKKRRRKRKDVVGVDPGAWANV
ncbi:hypothetical protein HDU93_007812, partial [Gonapodya sp. JEL0774]